MFDIDAGCFCEYFAYEVGWIHGCGSSRYRAYERQAEFLVHACPLPSKGGGVLLVFQVFWSSWGDSVTFLVARKLPIQQQLQGGRAHFSSQSKGMQFLLVGKAWSQVREADGLIVPAVRKQGAVANATAQLVVG